MTTGIRTLEDIRQRCYVDEATGCWHWRGGNSNSQPTMWIPALGKTGTLGMALCTIEGAPIGKVLWRRTCASEDCCARHHRVRSTRSQLMRASGSYRKTGAWLARCRGPRRFSDETVRAIREAPGTLAAVAAAHGCSASYVSRLRLGELRVPRDAIGTITRALAG